MINSCGVRFLPQQIELKILEIVRSLVENVRCAVLKNRTFHAGFVRFRTAALTLLLRQIPFKGILTTNYNPLLKGVTPFDKERSRKAYRDILRTRNFDEDIVKVLDLNDKITNFDYGVAVSKNDKIVYKSVPNPVIQLHGNLSKSESVVLTSQSYRRLLYEIPGYLMFLKSLLASKTVLFVGFSFTDAYLNEIRSEVMALLGSEGKEPVAYAITPNKSNLVCDYNMRHFGTKFMNYDTSGPLGYEAFDPIFEALAEKVDKAVKYN